MRIGGDRRVGFNRMLVLLMSAMQSMLPGRLGCPTMVAASGDLFMGIDCGTQSTKALVYDASTKRVLGTGSCETPLDPNPEGIVGRAEQSPKIWVDAMIEATSAALAAAAAADGCSSSSIGERVRCIGVSGQQHGLVALDAEYEVIRPAKLWCDVESSAEAAELTRALGSPIVPSFTITKLLWLKRHEPERFERLAHIALPHDYLNYVLTGRLVAECGDASGTGLLDPKTRTWDEDAARLVDDALFDKLPPLIGPAETVGRLRPEAASMLGLAEGVAVAPGGGDNMMSALGCGCTTVGRVAMSLGTSGTLFARTASAALDPSGAVCPFLDATGGGLPLLCTLNCAAPAEEVRHAFGLSREEITELALKESPGCEGVTFLPYLNGERSPNWPGASGAVVGLRPGLLRPGLLYRAAVEGAVFGLKAGISALQEHGVPARVSELRLVGGGSRSALWRQIIADATQMRVAVPVEAESAALGAALQAAAVHAGADDLSEWISSNHDAPIELAVEPNRDHVVIDAYESAYQRFRERGGALFAP